MRTEPPKGISLLCGLIAGVAQAAVFNPYDRALYLSVKHHRPFLDPKNFENGYQGFLQSVGGRALASGLYYPLEHAFLNLVPADGKPHPYCVFLAGTAAGAANAIILNPLSAVKYKTWGREVNRGMKQEVLEMWKKGGFRPFLNGLRPTLYRDVVFGGCYTYLRYVINSQLSISREHQWIGNVTAAAVATIASGPFNLARNVQYATKSKKQAPTIPHVLYKLTEQVAAQDTVSGKLHLLQNRLRIGFGTARVALGMAFGHYVYDQCMVAFDKPM